MWQYYRGRISELRRAFAVLSVTFVFFGAAGLFPLLDGGRATAATITNRNLTLSTAVISASATYTFNFTPAQTTQIESLFFQACTTPIGTCTAPAGINLSGGTVGQSGFQGATVFTKDTTTTTPVACNVTTNLCAKRTDTTSQTLTAHTFTDTGATNPNGTSCSTINCTFFVRITSFSDNAYTTAVDSGTVASSTTQTLTINATIQEQLIFCIGATAINDATTAPAACSSISGTSLSLGPLSSSNVSVSPVSSGNGGDGNNGIAELSTNATSGASVVYDAIQQSGTNHLGTLRVAGATCNAGTVNTDQCVNAIGTTKSTLTAGTEAFGMAIGGVNCAATSAYTCSYAGNTYNLRKDTTYDATGSATTYDGDNGLIAGTTAGSYAWDESGTAGTVASSSTVLDKEALILKFAASPTVVTPTGSYTAKADFVATPTF